MKHWTEEETQFLKDNYLNMPNQTMADILERTISSVNHQYQRMNLPLKKEYNVWTKNEIETLKINYPIITDSNELYNMLPNKTPSAIKIKARRLKLYKNNDIYKDIKKQNSHKSNLYWSKEKEKILIEYIDKFGVDENLYKIFPEHIKQFIDDKLIKLGYKDMSSIKSIHNLLLNKNIKNLNLQDIIFIYKKILSGELNGFNDVLIDKYKIIFCFKYYLYINNINFNKRDWIKLNFGDFIQKTKLKLYIKKVFGSYYNFITECFPNYGFKQWEFEILDVPNNYWENKYNRFSCIKYGLENLLSDGWIKNYDEVFNITKDLKIKYFHKTLIAVYGVNSIIEFFDFNKIKYNLDALNYYNDIRFESKEERDLYVFLEILGFNIEKCGIKDKFYNSTDNENYIPDYIIRFMDKKILIEYFGMYKEYNMNSHIKYINYYHKMKRKICFYNSLKEDLFLDIYPSDIKNDYKKLRRKLTDFFMSNFNITLPLKEVS